MWRWGNQKTYRNKKVLYLFYRLKNQKRCLFQTIRPVWQNGLYNLFDIPCLMRPANRLEIIFHRQFLQIPAILFSPESPFPNFLLMDFLGQLKLLYNL